MQHEGLSLPLQGGRRHQSSGSSILSPSQPKSVVPGWQLENLSEDFLPWDWSSCHKTHSNSSTERQLPLWLHSAEHLHFLAVLLANLQALPVESIVSCLISLLHLSSESHFWFTATQLGQCNLDQNQALRCAPAMQFCRLLHFITRNL